jgi:hypothetical protein
MQCNPCRSQEFKSSTSNANESTFSVSNKSSRDNDESHFPPPGVEFLISWNSVKISTIQALLLQSLAKVQGE